MSVAGTRQGVPAIDFGLGDAMVPAAGDAGPHAPLVDPVLQRGVADAEPGGGLSDGQECHDLKG